MTPNIRPLVAGNWKMNGQRDRLDTIHDIAQNSQNSELVAIDMLLCPPATLLYVATTLCEDVPLTIGGQDCHTGKSGPHTGDISAAMLADCQATHVIVGHSERRHNHHETNAMVKAKAQAAFKENLVAIICIGETEEERKSGHTLDVLKTQLKHSVPDNTNAQNTIIAYEPVWAIGTGLIPEDEDIRTAHAFMRNEMVNLFHGEGNMIRLLYGGSVKPDNVKQLVSIPNVDGVLVGGASLKADDFLSICHGAAACMP